MEFQIDDFSKVKKLLGSNDIGLTIKEISKELKLNRNSVAKYMEILLARGEVELKKIGPAKLYSYTKRIPQKKLLDFFQEPIILFDFNLNIVEYNNCIEEIFDNDILTFPLNNLNNINHPILDKDFLSKKIRELEESNEKFIGGLKDIYINSKKNYFKYNLYKICLRDGKKGFALILNDVTRTEKEKKYLKFKDRFEEVLADIASDFILISKERIPFVLQKSLEKISKLLNVNKAHIYLFTNKINHNNNDFKSFKFSSDNKLNKTYLDQKGMCHLAFSWTKIECIDIKDLEILNKPLLHKTNTRINIKEITKIFPNWFEELRKMKRLYFKKTSISNKWIYELEYMRELNSDFILIIPLIDNGELVGFIDFCMKDYNEIFEVEIDSIVGITGRIFTQIIKKIGIIEDEV